jgi:hypothetical protein
MSNIVYEGLSKTGPPGGSPIDFFPLCAPIHTYQKKIEQIPIHAPKMKITPLSMPVSSTPSCQKLFSLTREEKARVQPPYLDNSE